MEHYSRIWFGVEGYTGMREQQWYCPAVDREIDDSVCREYQRAGKGNGSQDTLRDLERWLRTELYRYGRRLEPLDLVERVTGSAMTVEPYLAYLRRKYGELHGA